MKRSEIKTLEKAHAILCKYTDDRPVQNLSLLRKMDEAYDGLSPLIYHLERHPLPTPLQSLKHRLHLFYYKHIIGI